MGYDKYGSILLLLIQEFQVYIFEFLGTLKQCKKKFRASQLYILDAHDQFEADGGNSICFPHWHEATVEEILPLLSSFLDLKNLRLRKRVVSFYAFKYVT